MDDCEHENTTMHCTDYRCGVTEYAVVCEDCGETLQEWKEYDDE